MNRAPVLFVAREPDETLRTFLPVIDRIRESFNLPSTVLFYHQPGDWARAELARREIRTRTVELPAHSIPSLFTSGRFGGCAIVRTADEVGRFWKAKRLANRILRSERPSAVVVIQDTLLLERFLIRSANQRGLSTLVIQWAFSYPQALYDRLRAIQHPSTARTRRGAQRRPQTIAATTRTIYRSVLDGLGLSFDLARSYGGGEARSFAVWGQAFKDQFESQGVRGRRIVVTGHPTHDVAFARRRSMGQRQRAKVRERYGLPIDRPIALYATQPVLWRKVLTEEQLRANVEAIASAVTAVPGNPLLAIKLHPRETTAQYSFCDDIRPPVRVIAHAEVADLIGAADVFISSSSSTVLLAMMLDRPIVTVNFNEVPHFDYFEDIGGSLHTRTSEEFGEAIRSALTDSRTQAMLARGRTAALERFTCFDGRATDRIAGLIGDAVSKVEAREAAG